MACYDSGGLRTEAAVTEAHGNKTERERICHFFFAEIAFRSDENQHVSALLYLIFEETLLVLVTMGDEILPLGTLYFVRLFFNELVVRRQFMQNRQEGRQTLFCGREDDFLEPVCSQLFAFGEAAEQRSYFIHSDLHAFLNRPLQTLDVLRRRNRYMEMKIMMLLLFLA